MAVKRRKNKHKTKLRASIRNTMFLFFGIMICVSMYNILVNTLFKPNEEQEQTIYKTKESFKQENSVVIKKNKYMEAEDIKENQAYVTDLLQKIKTNYTYKYEGENIQGINVTYKVKATLKSSYLHEGKEEEFWNKDYILLEEKSKKSENNVIEINEDLEIDVTKYNDLVKEFVEEIQISIASKLCVNFEVNISAFVNGERVIDNYNNEMQITLGDKLTNISGKFDDEKEDAKTNKLEVKKETNRGATIGWTLLAITSVFGIIKMKKDTKTTNRITNTFKIELNQILNSCGDRIIKIDSNHSIYGNNTIEVRDINELVKLSEETFKPILYYQVPNKNSAWFYIVLDKEIYRYILK